MKEQEQKLYGVRHIVTRDLVVRLNAFVFAQFLWQNVIQSLSFIFEAFSLFFIFSFSFFMIKKIWLWEILICFLPNEVAAWVNLAKSRNSEKNPMGFVAWIGGH